MVLAGGFNRKNTTKKQRKVTEDIRDPNKKRQQMAEELLERVT